MVSTFSSSPGPFVRVGTPSGAPGRPVPPGRPDLSALAVRLDDFDRRLREVKSMSHLVEAKTAAYVLLRAEGARPLPAPSTATRAVRLAIDLSPARE